MTSLSGASVHPTAFVDPTANLAEGVIVGPGAFVGPLCVIGEGTRVRHGATIAQHTTIGRENDVHTGAVLGGDPQDLKYNPENPGALFIGDRNVFREGVTISRSVGDQQPTRIGSGCYFMTNSHVGHNAQIGEGVIMTNCAVVAGWAELGDGVILSAHTGVHQYCRVGERAMFQGHAGASKHVPPFCMVGGTNHVSGLNMVGIRRLARLTDDDRREIREAFRILFQGRDAVSTAQRLERADAQGFGAEAMRFVDFVRATLEDEGPRRRGLVSRSARRRHGPAERNEA